MPYDVNFRILTDAMFDVFPSHTVVPNVLDDEGLVDSFL